MVESYVLDRIPELYPRSIEPVLQQDIEKGRRISVLLGSRQAGKTSLIYRLIDFLLNKKGVDPAQVIYLDLEFPQILSQVNGLFGQDFVDFLSARGMDTASPGYVFIDEIHYLDNPSSFLKTLHDHFPQITIIVSGSSSLKIKKKFKDSLTGRKSIVSIHTLDFHEYLQFTKSPLAEQKAGLSLQTILESRELPDLSELRFLQNDFQKKYEEFSVFGGYPGIAFLETPNEKTRLLDEIYQSYVMKDIKDVGKIENLNAFNSMIALLGHQIGSLINISELCVSIGISRPTVEHYLFLLEQTFILTRIQPYFTNKRKEIVKSPKIYFNDPGLRNTAVRNMDGFSRRGDHGLLFENAVFSQLRKTAGLLESVQYYRTKGKAEIDFILNGKEIIPIEVKSGTFKQPKIPSSLRAFINAYSPKSAFVINRDFWAEEKVNGTTVYFIPAWAV